MKVIFGILLLIVMLIRLNWSRLEKAVTTLMINAWRH